MKIVVCIKQVPDTTEIRLDPVTGTLIRDGVPSIMNPDDKAGLEMALELKDQYGAHVTVITMGPPQADDILREQSLALPITGLPDGMAQPAGASDQEDEDGIDDNEYSAPPNPAGSGVRAKQAGGATKLQAEV